MFSAAAFAFKRHASHVLRWVKFMGWCSSLAFFFVKVFFAVGYRIAGPYGDACSFFGTEDMGNASGTGKSNSTLGPGVLCWTGGDSGELVSGAAGWYSTGSSSSLGLDGTYGVREGSGI